MRPRDRPARFKGSRLIRTPLDCLTTFAFWFRRVSAKPVREVVLREAAIGQLHHSRDHLRLLSIESQAVQFEKCHHHHECRPFVAVAVPLGEAMPFVRTYLQSGWVRAGLILLVLGTGPLVAFMLYAKLGFYDDPNPNLVALGIPAMLTFWPSVAMIAWGSCGSARVPPRPNRKWTRRA